MKTLLSEWKRTSQNITVIVYYALSFLMTVFLAGMGLLRLTGSFFRAAFFYDFLSLLSLILFFYIGKRVREGTLGKPIGKGYEVIVLGFIFGATALFFLDGGLFGGSSLFFLIGLMLTPSFFRLKQAVFLMCLQLAAYCGDIALSLKYPESVHAAGYSVTDTLPVLLFAGLVLGAFSLFYIGAYHNQKRSLTVALEEARRANDAKASFLDNMSHEIRTPMNTILGMNEMILREERRPEIIEYAAQIDRSGRALLSVINDILDYSKIQDNKMQITPIRYDLSSLINDMVNIAADLSKRKSLEFHVYTDRAIPRVLSGDEFHIRQIILNIINNAVKYTANGGVSFRVGFEKLDEESIRLRFSVEDTGIGIRPEDMEHIFTPFEHAGSGSTLRPEGAGLGLSIVKHLLDLMESKLEISSVPGEGSTFSFAIIQKVLKWEPLGDYSAAYRQAHAHTFERKSFVAPSATVLVVDDTPVNLVVFQNLLKDTQIRIDTATSGQEMLQMARGRHYDMIFVDHRMPGMDGIEAFHALRAMTKNNLNLDTPVVALTANAVMGARQMYLDEGFTDYLSKPVDSLRLEQTLKNHLPPEYIEEVTVGGNADMDVTEGTGATVTPVVDKPASPYASIPGIDYDAAITNCGSADTFEKALRVFYETLDDKADDIERFAAQGEIRDYTILVHALKSSARLVGALELSADALHLEECGNREDAAEIEAKTPALLSDYRAFKERLAPFFDEGPEDTARRPLMSAEDLQEFYGAVKECADAFDLDGIDELLATAGDYTIPEDDAERFDALKKAVLAADWNEIGKVLG